MLLQRRSSLLLIPKQALFLRTVSAAAVATPRVASSLLKQCKSILQAELVHQQLLIHGLITRFSIHLVSTYIALDAPSHALLILRGLAPSPYFVFWWNALIRRAVHSGFLGWSLALFHEMRRLGWYPDHYTFPFVLKACGELPSFGSGAFVHGVVCKDGFLSNVFVCNALVAMYGRCGEVQYARQMFDEMLESEVFDLVSWNSIFTAYVQCGDPTSAINLFRRMCVVGDVDMRPDVVSLVNVLPVCAATGSSLLGRQVHGFAVRKRLVEDVFVANSLVDMYAKCGRMHEAKQVFEQMKDKDVVSWNAMVTGYSQIGKFDDALSLLENMKEENIELDVVSWECCYC